MCFSATASFCAGTVLLAGGALSIKNVKDPKFYPFASIPFIFGIQQLAEGLLWLSFTSPTYEAYRESAMYAFLVFAQIVWPAFVPFAIWLMEPDQKRKRILGYISIIGVGTAIFLAYALFSFPVNSSVSNYHIHYALKSQKHFLLNSSIFYFIATVVSSFVSSISKMKLFGSVILLSLIVSEVFFHDYVISVWCFFAACLSIIILFILKETKKAQ